MPDWSKNALLLAAALLLVVGGIGRFPPLTEAATVAAVIGTLAQWPRLFRMGRIFIVAAILSGAAVALAYPARLGEVHAALVQGVAFAVLLSTIGVMRHAVRRSEIAADAARTLISAPARSRYAAINVGCHFLSLLFNVGIIALIGELLGGGSGVRVSRSERRRLLLAGMRGTVLMTVWSPMGLGFAIVTTGIVGLDPVAFLMLSFAVAIVLVAVTCVLFGGAESDTAAAEEDGERRSIRPVVTILGVGAGLLAATIGLHLALGTSFIVATAAVIPVISLIWVAAEPTAGGRRLGEDLAAMFRGLSDMRGESAVFLSANVIGAAISIVVREQSFWQVIQNGAWPDLWIIAACLTIVPLAGAAMIPHSIFVVLIVQLFGDGSAGHHHPMTLALALTLGWAMAIAVSPISAMSMITGHLAGVPSHVVGLRWNARFVAALFALSVGLILVAYGCGL
jgi:hypothetical protein